MLIERSHNVSMFCIENYDNSNFTNKQTKSTNQCILRVAIISKFTFIYNNISVYHIVWLHMQFRTDADVVFNVSKLKILLL